VVEAAQQADQDALSGGVDGVRSPRESSMGGADSADEG
jgi:hypothetical protein